MEQKFFDAVNAEISPLLLQNGYEEKDGAFVCDNAAYKVEYNEANRLFELKKASVAEGVVGEYTVISAYLFDEDSTERDATAVGIDFLDTVTTGLGLNPRKTRSASAVALPQKSDGETPGLSDLTSKLLAVFPALKDTYKEHIEENGEFLYVNFYLEHFVPLLAEMLREKPDKKLRKLFDTLNELYCKGDRTVGNLIVVVLIGGAIKGDREALEAALALLSEHQHLKSAVHNIAKRTARDKKLKELYGIN